MNRVSKLTARIAALRADEIELKSRHTEALIAQADDDFGDVDRRAVKKIAEQLAGVRSEIEMLESALDRAAELDKQDAQTEADQLRVVEFEQFEASLQPRLEAAQRFEVVLEELIESIKQVQAADAEMPAGMRREAPWKHGLVAALAGVIGREELPQPGDAPQPRAFWNRSEAGPVSAFILREHQHRAFNEAAELHAAGLLDSAPSLPDHMRTEPTEPKPEATASRPEIFNGTFAQMPDGFYLRECDARVFKKTEHGFEVAVGHPGYNNRRTMTTREIA